MEAVEQQLNDYLRQCVQWIMLVIERHKKHENDRIQEFPLITYHQLK